VPLPVPIARFTGARRTAAIEWSRLAWVMQVWGWQNNPSDGLVGLKGRANHPGDLIVYAGAGDQVGVALE